MEEQKDITRQGIIYKKQINKQTYDNEEFNTIIILNENIKNRSASFAEICSSELVRLLNIDKTKIENYEDQYQILTKRIFNELEFAFDIRQEQTKEYNYRTEYGNNNFGYINNTTLFIVYNNGKKVSEEIVKYDESLYKINLDVNITKNNITIKNENDEFYSSYVPEEIEIESFKNKLDKVKQLAKTYNTRLKNISKVNKFIQDFKETNTYLIDLQQARENFDKQIELLQSLKKIGYVKKYKELEDLENILPAVKVTKSMEKAFNIENCFNHAIEELQYQNKESFYTTYGMMLED